MIVYFFKKSKELILFWSKICIILILFIYAFFVMTRVFLIQKTIQIIQNSSYIAEKRGEKLGSSSSTINNTQDPYVASKRGTYYYPVNCSKAKGLSPQNMLYFKDKISAEQAGYKAHSSCK